MERLTEVVENVWNEATGELRPKVRIEAEEVMEDEELAVHVWPRTNPEDRNLQL